MNKEIKNKLWSVGIFAMAMAFVEMMIVYYLRILYYPSQILFPINTNMPVEIWVLEMVREFFTIIMLLAVAYIAGKNLKERFAYFAYAFAIWDIFYYIWLKVAINWPSSWFEWDILFLIPGIWASPWIAPVLVSFILIALSIALLQFPKQNLNAKEISLLILAFIITLLTFIWDYGLFYIKNGAKFSENLTNTIATYVPTKFNWILFIFALILACGAIVSFYRRAKKQK